MLKTPAYAAPSANAPLAPYAIERRQPGPHDVLIDILYCGVCHSDIHQARDEWGGSIFPMVPGHEIVGLSPKSATGSNNGERAIRWASAASSTPAAFAKPAGTARSNTARTAPISPTTAARRTAKRPLTAATPAASRWTKAMCCAFPPAFRWTGRRRCSAPASPLTRRCAASACKPASKWPSWDWGDWATWG